MEIINTEATAPLLKHHQSQTKHGLIPCFFFTELHLLQRWHALSGHKNRVEVRIEYTEYRSGERPRQTTPMMQLAASNSLQTMVLNLVCDDMRWRGT